MICGPPTKFAIPAAHDTNPQAEHRVPFDEAILAAARAAWRLVYFHGITRLG